MLVFLRHLRRRIAVTSAGGRLPISFRRQHLLLVAGPASPLGARVCIPSWAVLRVWLALPMRWLLSGSEGREGGGGIKGCGCG